jgi:hypothetical protein
MDGAAEPPRVRSRTQYIEGGAAPGMKAILLRLTCTPTFSAASKTVVLGGTNTSMSLMKTLVSGGLILLCAGRPRR